MTLQKIQKAYTDLDDALVAIDSEHDCHASADDGCDCITLGHMRLDLSEIYKFITKYYEKKDKQG